MVTVDCFVCELRRKTSGKFYFEEDFIQLSLVIEGCRRIMDGKSDQAVFPSRWTGSYSAEWVQPARDRALAIVASHNYTDDARKTKHAFDDGVLIGKQAATV